MLDFSKNSQKKLKITEKRIDYTLVSLKEKFDFKTVQSGLKRSVPGKYVITVTEET